MSNDGWMTANTQVVCRDLGYQLNAINGIITLIILIYLLIYYYNYIYIVEHNYIIVINGDCLCGNQA